MNLFEKHLVDSTSHSFWLLPPPRPAERLSTNDIRRGQHPRLQHCRYANRTLQRSAIPLCQEIIMKLERVQGNLARLVSDISVSST